MPASVTSNFRITNAKQFIDSFEEPENGGRQTVVGTSYVYMFIGKSLSWDKTHAGYSDIIIPSPDGDVQGNEFEPWRDMIALDRVVANTDIFLGAKRYDWVSGTLYAQYDDQDPAITKATANFYVYEPDAGAIFKCLDNGDGVVPSTVKPLIPLAGSLHTPFVKTDGYRWKYMGSVPPGTSKRFLTTNYIPIYTLNAIPGSSPEGGEDTELDGQTHSPTGFENQSEVQKNANNGTIETYVVVSGGAGFTVHSAAVAATGENIIDLTTSDYVANTTFFSLTESTALLTGTGYKGAAIFLSNTTHQKGVGWIKDYGSLHNGTVIQNRAVLLDPGITEEGHHGSSGSTYIGEDPITYTIAPIIDVVGDGPQNADGRGGANAYAICTTDNQISQINVWTSGNNYTTATVSPIEYPGGLELIGTGLSARGVISPPGGHGSDIVTELNGFNVIISKTLTGAGLDNPIARNTIVPTGTSGAVTGTSGAITGNNFPISNEYRTIGLVRNAYIREDYDATVLSPATGGKNWYANSSPLHQTTWIVANTTELVTWTPTADDEIQGDTSKAIGRIIEYNADTLSKIMVIGNVVANTSGGSFMFNEKINKLRDKAGVIGSNESVHANGYFPEGGLGAATTVIYEPDLQPYTGDILYIENRSPITRTLDQSEDIKIVIEF